MAPTIREQEAGRNGKEKWSEKWGQAKATIRYGKKYR